MAAEYGLGTMLAGLCSMNFIRHLQSENQALSREVVAIKSGLNDLRAYLQSPKFRCGDPLDSYVNLADVLAYLRNAENAGTVARESGVTA